MRLDSGSRFFTPNTPAWFAARRIEMFNFDCNPRKREMSNVFENQVGDARQTDAAAIPDDCKLFRKRYRQLSPEEIALHDAIKDKADELAALIARINNPPSPEKRRPNPGAESVLFSIADNNYAHVVLALRHLEDCVYRAVKALTA